MKMYLTISFLLTLGCSQSYASKPTASPQSAKQLSTTEEGDYLLLTDGASPIPGVLWRNALLNVVSQVRVAQIERLKAEKQLKEAECKRLKEELAQSKKRVAILQGSLELAAINAGHKIQVAHEANADSKQQLRMKDKQHEAFKLKARELTVGQQKEIAQLKAAYDALKVQAEQAINDLKNQLNMQAAKTQKAQNENAQFAKVHADLIAHNEAAVKAARKMLSPEQVIKMVKDAHAKSALHYAEYVKKHGSPFTAR